MIPYKMLLERRMTIKKFWLSVIIGTMIGVLISLFVFDNNSLFFQYRADYPGATMFINEVDFNVLFNYLTVILASILVIFIGWTLIEKVITKNG